MFKNILILLFSILIINSVSLAQGGGLIIGDNYRVFPSTTSQSEVFITKHPTNSSILFSSANTLQFTPTFFVSEGVYVSTDAGQSWYGSDTCKGANIFFHGGDPSIAIDKDGNFILTRKGSTSFPGVYSHYSTDNGITWSAQRTISTDELERATIVSDSDPSSPYLGRTYVCWAKLVPPYSIGFSYTNDGAQNWFTPSSLSTVNLRRAGGEIALGPENQVYICWAGVTSTSPFTEVQVGFASSTNGGTNWNVNENAFNMNGIVGILANKQNIRVNGLPRIAVDLSNKSTRGNIYIVTAQKNLLPAGSDPDIILRKSTDAGQTWSAGIRVNQDALNNGKTQFFTGITVDENGGLNIIYYDDRNTTSDSSSIFLARSTDGGSSFNEYEISDHNFKPSAIGGLGQGYMGDNIDITSVGNKLYPVWMDNSTGTYQIWSVPIEILSVGVDDENNFTVPSEFELKQNYPNPFNPSTSIEFNLPIGSNVSLKIFDATGKEVVTLINEFKGTGNHRINFEANKYNLSSGVYFYTLSADGLTQTKPMILLK
ncbi:MAG: T9SS C-terminal target domain-containing protein [Ignavibacteriales bacterium]|nr:MAG: T9SS C-terminal target domain-containing protein [Ignavibacteriales bacterium]